MILGIDASNIRAGGGLTHLAELLGAAKPHGHGFTQVVIWGGAATLSRIDHREWLVKRHQPLLDKSLLHRVFWQRVKLGNLARESRADLLFVPGGSDASGFSPIVAMSQNLLPFEWNELRRYGWSLMTAKGLLLRSTQTRTFRRAAGTIFLSEHARRAVLRVASELPGDGAIIPHGVNARFSIRPRVQRPAAAFTDHSPCHVVYVSGVEPYKHHHQVARAVALLRSIDRLPITLSLAGPPGPALPALRDELRRLDPTGKFIAYTGAVPYDTVHQLYASADVGVFASSCETFGQILLEGMSAGLPIACANRSAMPEILGDAGVYFDPEQPAQIAAAIRSLFDSAEKRTEKANAAFERAKAFTWGRCADETFRFLSHTARKTAP